MATFAHLRGNIVIGTYRFYDELDGSSPEPIDLVESEACAHAFFSRALPEFLPDDDIKKSSYRNNFRKNLAGIGYTYDSERDAYIAPKPEGDWVLNDDCKWVAP